MSKIQKRLKPEEVQATIREFTRQFLGEALEADLSLSSSENVKPCLMRSKIR